MSGKLYIVATPIGNLKDITLRALETLKSVDRILCEDTRHSRILLKHYEIEKPLLSLHEHNEAARIPQVIRHLEAGESFALLSDAGTPLISDPGFRLVRHVIAENLELESLPGACAATNALVLSGLPCDRFYFVGFLPPKSAARLRKFTELKDHPFTLIFYESTHRIQKFLKEAGSVFGDRSVVLAREMTKKYEEITRSTLAKFAEGLEPRSWKGEFVVLIKGTRE